MSGHKVSILFYEIAMLIVFSKNAVLIKKRKKKRRKISPVIRVGVLNRGKMKTRRVIMIAPRLNYATTCIITLAFSLSPGWWKGQSQWERKENQEGTALPRGNGCPEEGWGGSSQSTQIPVQGRESGRSIEAASGGGGFTGFGSVCGCVRLGGVCLHVHLCEGMAVGEC